MQAEKLLIVGPSWVGDMVMAQSLFITLKQQNPERLIDVLAPAWSFPLLERMPEINQGVSMPVGHGALQLRTRYRLAQKLRQAGYQQAIVLPNSLKSALVPWFAGIPKRTGWKGEMRYGLLNDLRPLDKAAFPLMVDRFNALALDAAKIPTAAHFTAPHPAPRLVADPNEVEEALHLFRLNHRKPVLALCPGAEFGEAKRWPSEHYAAVALEKLTEGWQVWLFGSQKDREVCDEIISLVPKKHHADLHSLAGETKLGQAVDLLSVADAVVSNDSGLMHISAALGRPLVVVYGSSSPDFTPPLSNNHRVVRLGLECSPCFKRTCPLQHLNCLRELAPQRVLTALKELENQEQ